MTQLRTEHLQKRYKSRIVVKDISIQVNKGEIVGLLGPNGAGKTTSFYMIVGLIKSDQGHVFLDNQDITKLPMHKRAQLGIGYLPQEASIFRKLNVSDNIMAILELQKNRSKQQRLQRLEDLLLEFHIEHLRTVQAMRLSGGERRRVEIARALATNPKFMLLDEPFAGIDPISVVDIKSIIKQLSKRGIGVLITDHNVRETLDICQRAYIVNEGTILAEGNPQEILNDTKVRNIYLGEAFDL